MADSSKAVFLSYASQDAEAARRICDALRAAGVEVWFDQSELRDGDAWDQKIRRQIRECALFVPIISASTQARREGYFRLEWKLAEDRSHLMAKGTPFIVPVCIDDTRDRSALVPDTFLSVQWARIRSDDALSGFVARIGSLLGTTEDSDRPKPTPLALPVQPRPVRRTAWVICSCVVGIGVAAGLWFIRSESKKGPTASGVPTAATASTRNDKSIAVLPFANRSSDKDNGYFADGLHDDVVTNLSNIRDLRVVSSVSVETYRETRAPMRQIAEELGVAYLLKGSVQRAGNKLHLNAQLVDARGDRNVWAKTYDKDVNDVFAIQAEIANAIATELHAVLSPAEQKLIAQPLTRNAEAYDLYLQDRRFSSGAMDGIPPLERAVALDPDFAAAWSRLATRHGSAYMLFLDRTPARLAKAKTAMETAVRLAPDSPSVAMSLGMFYYQAYRDYDRALAKFEEVLRLQPNSPSPRFAIALVQRRQGKRREALEGFWAAVKLDPKNPLYVLQAARTASLARRYPEAIRAYRQLLTLEPQNPEALRELARIPFLVDGSRGAMDAYVASLPADKVGERIEWALTCGKLEEAERWDKQSPAPSDSTTSRALLMGMTAAARGDLPAVRRRLQTVPSQLRTQLEAEPENAVLWGRLAWVQAVLGENEEARGSAGKAAELLPESLDTFAYGVTAARVFVLAWTGDKDSALAEYSRLLGTSGAVSVEEMRHHPSYHPLRSDPRFSALLNDPKNKAPLF